MAKVVKLCPTCKKPAEQSSQMRLGSLFIVTYKCGHTHSTMGAVSEVTDTLDITSLDGKRPFKYQLEGGQFIERSNFRALVADEMGLGKTIQAIMAQVAHKDILGPFVAFVKSGLKTQWMKECVRWGDLLCQVIEGGKSAFLLPGMDGYIIGLDSAWRIPNLQEQLDKCKVKSIIIDECQLIKNSGASRTKAIQAVAKTTDYIIALSGTPIKNNAAEFFPILNILKPERFPKESQFVFGWCDSYSNGYSTKTGGIKDMKKFEAYTNDFIIRRLRKDVLPDLPHIFRKFTYAELGKDVEQAYLDEVKAFQDYCDDEGGKASAASFASNLLAFFSKMRHLTGIAKVDPVCEFVEEFITTTDRKLAIFVHHKDVGQILKLKLEKQAKEWQAEYGPEILQLTSDMDSEQRDNVIMKWKNSSSRVCILSTLAAGEGLNLQFCSDCVIMERQWNPANEEQVEARFPRPGSTAERIDATYFIATGTIDEFFTELVERKREIVNKTLNGEAVKWDESSLMRDLADVIMQKGGKRWGYAR